MPKKKKSKAKAEKLLEIVKGDGKKKSEGEREKALKVEEAAPGEIISGDVEVFHTARVSIGGEGQIEEALGVPVNKTIEGEGFYIREGMTTPEEVKSPYSTNKNNYNQAQNPESQQKSSEYENNPKGYENSYENAGGQTSTTGEIGGLERTLPTQGAATEEIPSITPQTKTYVGEGDRRKDELFDWDTPEEKRLRKEKRTM